MIVQGPSIEMYDGLVRAVVFIDDTDGRAVRVDTVNNMGHKVGFTFTAGDGTSISGDIPKQPRSNTIPAAMGTKVDMRDGDVYAVNPAKQGWSFVVESS